MTSVLTMSHFPQTKDTVISRVPAIRDCQACTTEKKKTVNVWCDGCYDMTHVGHIYSLWHAKAYGATLTVGVHCDHEIKQHKGLPVFSEEERYEMMRSIRFVDRVVEKSPYVTCPETMKLQNCDICVHGTDTTTTDDGTDTYYKVGRVKQVGLYKEVPRIPGISTTQILNKILHIFDKNNCNSSVNPDLTLQQRLEENTKSDECITDLIKSLKPKNNSQSIRTSSKKVVYAAGAFDILHVGNLSFLKAARALGNYLVVGLHDDELVRSYKGPLFPIMSHQKRHAALLACKYVDEVITGVPYSVSPNLLDTFNVSIVVQGTTTYVSTDPVNGRDPYEVPRIRNIYYEVNSRSDLTTERLIKRICSVSNSYEDRNIKKIDIDNNISFR